MKTWIVALALCCTLLAGCSQSAIQPTSTPTSEKPTATVVSPTSTPTSPPNQEQAATITPETEASQTLPPDQEAQEAMKVEWRPAIQNAIILSSACEWMFGTHANFQQGEIDIEETISELSIEADFISFTRWDSLAAYQNETVAQFMWRLEGEMGVLIELIDTMDDDLIGSPEVLDTLFPTCGSLLDLQSEIVFSAMDAGLTEESIDEIDLSDSEMYNDFYDMIMGGN